MFERILVGTDGSGTAAAAVAHAVGLAEAADAELLVLSAYTPQREGAPVFADYTAPGIDVAKGLLADVEKRHGARCRIRTLVYEGGAADALCDTAEAEKVDVIVVGNRGMTGAKRKVLGSIPNTVSHHAPCNVLIVHTTDE